VKPDPEAGECLPLQLHLVAHCVKRTNFFLGVSILS
jgi:hypothetical protein